MECGSSGVMGRYFALPFNITPSLHYTITPQLAYGTKS